MKQIKNPMQPIIFDEHKVIRFKDNKIVRYLLDNGGIDLNDLADLSKNFLQDDQEQFAQLIGYSVSGFGDLNYVSKKTVAKADKIAENLWESRI